MLEVRAAGIYCPAGGFYIDPWRPVDRAVVTHGHSDHARFGSKSYLATPPTAAVMKVRLGAECPVQPLDFGEQVTMGDAKVSLHPAGHILGSAQVRVEVAGEVWVVSGDYKTSPDRSVESYEPVRCHGFVTETTFGLPVYRWQPEDQVISELKQWWKSCAEKGQTAMVFAYALGKAQRLLGALADVGEPIYVHGSIPKLNQIYEEFGVNLGDWRTVAEEPKGKDYAGSLVIAPQSAAGTPWVRRFGDVRTAFASGWMAIRGHRRRRSVDRGFVLSDHVDWNSLQEAVAATGCETVWTTHGFAEQTARAFADQGLKAKAISGAFTSAEDEDDS